MGEYEVGYCKPPKHSRFVKGVCPNPRGRGKGRPTAFAQIVEDFLNTRINVRENGRVARITRREASVKRLVAAAMKGDVASANALLSLWRRQRNDADDGPIVVTVLNAPSKSTAQGARVQVRENTAALKAKHFDRP